jgi:hypothetical protein
MHSEQRAGTHPQQNLRPWGRGEWVGERGMLPRGWFIVPLTYQSQGRTGGRRRKRSWGTLCTRPRGGNSPWCSPDTRCPSTPVRSPQRPPAGCSAGCCQASGPLSCWHTDGTHDPRRRTCSQATATWGSALSCMAPARCSPHKKCREPIHTRRQSQSTHSTRGVPHLHAYTSLAYPRSPAATGPENAATTALLLTPGHAAAGTQLM